jgi:hypothetical protein
LVPQNIICIFTKRKLIKHMENTPSKEEMYAALNAGHKYWVDKGTVSLEYAYQQQLANDETAAQLKKYLKK